MCFANIYNFLFGVPNVQRHEIVPEKLPRRPKIKIEKTRYDTFYFPEGHGILFVDSP